MQATVTQLNRISDQLISLHLQPETDYPFLAGDYLWITPTEGERKPFSIASQPSDPTLVLHIKAQHRDDSWLADFVQKTQLGDSICISAAHTQYPAVPDTAQSVWFIAGGTGISPMKALAESLLLQQDTRPIHLFWGAKTEHELFLHQHFAQLTTQHSSFHYYPCTSQDDRSSCDYVQEHLQRFAAEQLAHTAIYICGPYAMNQTVKTDLIQQGAKADWVF